MENLHPEHLDLSDRKLDGLQVILWWVKGTLDCYVTVEDYKSGPNPTTMFVAVPAGESANDVFYHPFSYKGEPFSQGLEPYPDYLLDPDGTPRLNYGKQVSEDGLGTE